jgi:hypothetical protein
LHEIQTKAIGGETMITTSQILLQIEKHIHAAKTASSNQAIRDEFVAMKTLCEAFLSTEQVQVETKNAVPITTQPLATVNQLNVTKIDNDGANGDSIFDF